MIFAGQLRGISARPWLILCWLILCAGGISCTAAAADPVLQGEVTWVYDGDTLKVDGFGKVRLIGIDSPEKENSSRDNFYRRWQIPPAQLRKTARQALDFCIAEAKGQTVILTVDRVPRDRHGRLLAYVHLPDGRLLNRLLLEQGLATVYRRFDFDLKEEFLQTEQLARDRQIGLWRQQ